MSYETQALFELGVSWCLIRVVFEIDITPTHVIALNYVIFSNFK